MPNSKFIYQSDETVANTNNLALYWLIAENDITDFFPDGRRPNDEQQGTVTIPITVLNTANRERSGILPRGVVIVNEVSSQGGEIDIVKSFVPILRQVTFRRIKIGDAGVFRNMSYTVISKRYEQISL